MSSIRILQDIIDDNTDKMEDGLYVKISNALKDVYEERTDVCPDMFFGVILAQKAEIDELHCVVSEKIRSLEQVNRKLQLYKEQIVAHSNKNVIYKQEIERLSAVVENYKNNKSILQNEKVKQLTSKLDLYQQTFVSQHNKINELKKKLNKK